MKRVLIAVFALVLVFSAAAAASDNVIRINFQDRDTPVPEGWYPDYHELFGPKENGLVYGWSKAETMTRNRGYTDNVQLATMTHMRNSEVWEIELENGLWDVEVCIGDAWTSTYKLQVEDVVFWDNLTLENREWVIKSKTIEVTDGRLTLSPMDNEKWGTRICYIIIKPTGAERLPE